MNKKLTDSNVATSREVRFSSHSFLRLFLSGALSLSQTFSAPLGLAAFAAFFLNSSPIESAVVPQLINFQGRLTDSSNRPRTGTFNMLFEIYSAPTGGTLLWSETQNSVIVTNGVFSTQLGSVTPIQEEKFAEESAYIQITITGVSPVVAQETLLPRQRLLSSPYAMNASRLAGNQSAFYVSTAAVNQTVLGMKTFSDGVTASSVSLSGVTANPGSGTPGFLAYRSDTGQLIFNSPTGGWVALSTASVTGGTAIDTSASTQTKSGWLNVAGNVGIGTASASALSRLNVFYSNSGTSPLGSNAGISMTNVDATANNFSGLTFYNSAFGAVAAISAINVNQNGGGSQSGSLDLSVANAGAVVNAVRIKNDGSVGIGTTAPAFKTHVFSAATTAGPQLVVSTGTFKLFEVSGDSVTVGGSLWLNGSAGNGMLKVNYTGSAPAGYYATYAP